MSEASLLAWVQSLDGGESCNLLSQLSDGVTFFTLLSSISPNHFAPTLNIRKQSNWILKRKNLTKLQDSLQEFFQETCGTKHAELETINIQSIAKSGDSAEICKFVECIIGASVVCADKEKFVQNILSLPEKVQSDLRVVIERQLKLLPTNSGETQQQKDELGGWSRGSIEITRTPGGFSPQTPDSDSLELGPASGLVSSSCGGKCPECGRLSDLLRKRGEQFQRAKDAKESVQADYDALRAQMSILEKENNNLKESLRNAEARLRGEDDGSRKVEEEEDQYVRMYSEMKMQFEQLQSEHKSTLEENKHLVEEGEKKVGQILSLQRKVNELSEAAEQVRDVKDDNDLLREKVRKLERDASQLASLREQSSQVPILESKVDELQREIDSLSKELTVAGAGNRAVDATRRQIAEYKGEVSKLKGELFQAQRELEEEKAINENRKKEVRSLKADIASLTEQVQYLNSESGNAISGREKSIENLGQELGEQEGGGWTNLAEEIKKDTADVKSSRTKPQKLNFSSISLSDLSSQPGGDVLLSLQKENQANRELIRMLESALYHVGTNLQLLKLPQTRSMSQLENVPNLDNDSYTDARTTSSRLSKLRQNQELS